MAAKDSIFRQHAPTTPRSGGTGARHDATAIHDGLASKVKETAAATKPPAKGADKAGKDNG